ncbi:hypothetical protein [Neobacillus kokaensis]|uniref:Uncharacterized protein n=1 Tax=Neobacillus kokaensis TaxID=2759023 RepID=A0ABQ3MXN0_9BACI|nr:hypothetical protein [Neobacillus kokaensis]GHH96606.1 hypothetical protein AM1BK_01490 [Neobacillus kokaensis]
MKKFNATDSQLKRLIKLVNEKVDKEIEGIRIGKNKPFDADSLQAHLMNHGLREVEKFNLTDKNISFDAWMKKAINGDFLNFINVKKNQKDKFTSYEGLHETWGDSFISHLETETGASFTSEIKPFEGDFVEDVLEDFEADSLEEVKEYLEGLNLDLLSEKTQEELETLYERICQHI